MPCTSAVASNVAFKKVNGVVFEEDSGSEVEDVRNETANFMKSKLSNVHEGFTGGTGVGNSSLYEQWKAGYVVDPYDDIDFDALGLTEGQLAFSNALDINLRGQIR
ncbi:hypothetical protein Tco_0126702 [Tanacetum coccineum]